MLDLRPYLFNQTGKVYEPTIVLCCYYDPLVFEPNSYIAEVDALGRVVKYLYNIKEKIDIPARDYMVDYVSTRTQSEWKQLREAWKLASVALFSVASVFRDENNRYNVYCPDVIDLLNNQDDSKWKIKSAEHLLENLSTELYVSAVCKTRNINSIFSLIAASTVAMYTSMDGLKIAGYSYQNIPKNYTNYSNYELYLDDRTGEGVTNAFTSLQHALYNKILIDTVYRNNISLELLDEKFCEIFPTPIIDRSSMYLTHKYAYIDQMYSYSYDKVIQMTEAEKLNCRFVNLLIKRAEMYCTYYERTKNCVIEQN